MCGAAAVTFAAAAADSARAADVQALTGDQQLCGVDTIDVPESSATGVVTDWIHPGETMTVEVDGTPVTVANADGTWCAFEHMCPHQATPLGGLP